eukprot:gnl/TRDRNA2_/TRDRNA2_49958_c0_seq1.p2 gnl/TRDRNA2_/TRDRNA2_49958_c0~~gnl/TRDRNA2_/TRDRNA2_49958_c0_seq1.p2  ORF type:complete len:122 (-),score=13.63 gnl/TRDRNA2_/TRDRNA2_49958_c0_seq1:107-472(-)
MALLFKLLCYATALSIAHCDASAPKSDGRECRDDSWCDEGCKCFTAESTTSAGATPSRGSCQCGLPLFHASPSPPTPQCVGLPCTSDADCGKGGCKCGQVKIDWKMCLDTEDMIEEAALVV